VEKAREDDDEEESTQKREKCTINEKRNMVGSSYKREEPDMSSIYYDYV
jgi:hypothetical protein